LKQPLGLPWLDVHDLAGPGALERVSSEVPDDPNTIDCFGKLARRVGLEKLFDFV
jgi:hypothetical protein